MIGTTNTFSHKVSPICQRRSHCTSCQTILLHKLLTWYTLVKFPTNLTLNVSKTGAKAEWDFGSFKVMTLLFQISKLHYKSHLLLQPLRLIIPKITGYFHLSMMQDPVLVTVWDNEYSYIGV